MASSFVRGSSWEVYAELFLPKVGDDYEELYQLPKPYKPSRPSSPGYRYL